MANDPWYKDAIIYELDVARFADSNGDGFGDFPGAITKLDYLADLGITALWLLPFFPSPRKDDGYDITDYYGVDPRFGTLDDFLAFCRAAGERGIRIILDLVMNHTSDEHPWFRAARLDPQSRFRKYYTWTTSPPPVPPDKGPVVGTDWVKTVWTYDEIAGAYYFHRFYPFQPDLDFNNPEVLDEVHRFMDFWLAFGVAGFRLDAVPILAGAAGPSLDSHSPDPRPILKSIRNSVVARKADAALLGEADVAPERLDDYFAEGEGLNLLFNFLLCNYLWLGLARGEAEPIRRALMELPAKPANCQWANFLRNHDELDLEQLTREERQDVLSAFAPKEQMQAFGRGARRRLAPLLGGNRQRIALALSLLYSLPGAPVLFYGDEIGMGEDLSQPERASVRVPMQWDGSKHGGFSTAAKDALVQPSVADGPFGYKKVNVEAQLEDPNSLVNFVRKLNLTRRNCPEIARGAWHALETGSLQVLAHRCAWEDTSFIALHNLCDEKRTVELDLRAQRGRRLRGVLGADNEIPITDASIRIELTSYSFHWYRISGGRQA